jgi:hypothetical protein
MGEVVRQCLLGITVDSTQASQIAKGVIGSRYLGVKSQSPLYRRFGQHVVTFLTAPDKSGASVTLRNEG